MKVYAKNSFDRLGDDLTELILQYLTFEDKVRLECVSKQWRRLVFNKQFVIEISYLTLQKKYSLRGLFRRTTNSKPTLKRQALESVLKKCPNIIRVYLCLTINSSVLSLIGRYCHRIKSLKYMNRNHDNALDFYRINGHKLEELYIIGKDEEISKILNFCPNLKTINVIQSSLLISENKNFLPKLEHIIKMTVNFSSGEMNRMKILIDKYSQTLKKLDIDLALNTEEELKTCIECIARFENLKQLKLKLKLSEITEPIDDCLSLIGQKCNKLLKLDLYIDCHPISDRFFASFSEFKRIEELNVIFLTDSVMKGSIESLKHCKQLKHLFIHYPRLREDFFANIASFVPNLRSLEIHIRNQYSDSFIKSFHSMKNMETVILIVNNSMNKCYEEKNYYFDRSLSEVMLSPNGMNVKHITHNCGLIINN